MKSITSKYFAPSFFVLMMTSLGSSAFAAATWTIAMDTTCTSNATTQACSSSPALTASGWSTGTGTTTSPTAGSTFAAATVYNYSTSGLGLVATNESSTTGPHAIDNIAGVDALMLAFTGAPVNLSSLTIGWNGTDNRPALSSPYSDSDLSVLAWTGSGAPVMAGAGLSTMLTSGWSLIGNYSDVGSRTGNTQTMTSSTYSSYWLISAYSAAYGEPWSTGNDAFKVLAIAGTTYACSSNCGGSSVPEPSSMALLGAGLLGLVATRRQNQKRSGRSAFEPFTSA